MSWTDILICRLLISHLQLATRTVNTPPSMGEYFLFRFCDEQEIFSIDSIYESEILMQTTSQPSIARPLSVAAPSKVNWPHVAWFLTLAFGLSWLADLVLYSNGGLTSHRYSIQRQESARIYK